VTGSGAAETPDTLFDATPTELFEDAPCGYITTDLDGVLFRVNRTFERVTGHRREDLAGKVRFAELLSAGGRIYYETHYAPLLMMQGSVNEIALEIRRADGTLLPALVNSVLRHDDAGRPRAIRTTVFDATDRRRYERELLAARRREHDIAQQLQHSMLSGALPSGPGFELEVFYSPAEQMLEIGGDWYDAFWLDDATIALVIGDVVGRGIAAAATMGQLRSAVRALAATGLSPAGLLRAMDAYCRRHDLGHTTTTIYAQLELPTRRLRFACAGHPPPAVADPGGVPAFLWTGRSWPLAVALGAVDRPEATHALTPGSTVLLYTDGLVERRRRPLKDGMGRLLAEFDRRRELPVSAIVSGVAQALAAPSQSDDVCVLGLKLG
jgi:PAS domain S-box-containing protein